MALVSMLSLPNVLIGLAVSLTFLAMGFYGLYTGSAVIKFYRFRRDQHPTRFWLVTTMWLGAGSILLLHLFFTWIGEPRGS